MADLVVDLDGLDRLAGALERIQSQLARAKADLHAGSDVLGDSEVVDGLDRFEERWRDGRKSISENAETLHTMLTESVRTYTDADQQLAAGLSTSCVRTEAGGRR